MTDHKKSLHTGNQNEKENEKQSSLSRSPDIIKSKQSKQRRCTLRTPVLESGARESSSFVCALLSIRHTFNF